MNTGRTSLRAKLVGAAALVVAASSSPLIYLGYVDAYDHAVDAAAVRFDNVTRIVADEIERSYLNIQTLVVEKAAIERDDIIAELDAVEQWMRDGRLQAMTPTFEFLYKAWGTNVGVVNERGEFMSLSPAVLAAWKQNPVDHLGVPFRDYLKNTGRSFTRDEFTFLRLPEGAVPDVPAATKAFQASKAADASDGGGEASAGAARTPEGKAADQKGYPYLVAVRKVAGSTVVVMQILDYLEPSTEDILHQLSLHAADALKTVSVSPQASLRVADARGERITGRGVQFGLGSAVGDAGSVETPAALAALRRKAADDGFASGVVPHGGGDLLVAVRHIRAFGWNVEGAVPLDVITAPAVNYARRLAGTALIVFSVIALAGLMLVGWFLQPLRRLAEGAAKLEAVDLKSERTAEELYALRAALPRGADDEVGRVSRAFGGMITALAKNIRDLKETLARQHGIEGEMRAAHEIQRGMLETADKVFRAPGFEAFALMEAARDVGGDFYDVMELPGGRRALVVGDVSGKGASAALLMAVSLTLVRNALTDGFSPAQLIKKVNDQIAARNPACMFVTLWVGVFDPATGELVYANGGHCPPLGVRFAGSTPRLRRLDGVSGPLVGALDGADYVEFKTTVEADESILVYSDGVSEAMNDKRELFGDDRIASVLSERDLRPQAAAQALMRAILAHRGAVEQSDDITMLIFRRTTDQEAEA